MEALPGLWSLSPIAGMLGMLALLYWLLATGRLVTKSSHEREVGIYKELRVTDVQTISTLQVQNAALLEVGKTMEAVLKSAGPPVTPVGGA